MAKSLIRSNESTLYLYTSREIINIVKSSLFECILNLLNIAIIFRRVIYLYSWILVSILSIKRIE